MERNTRQRGWEWVKALIDIKLNEKEGTQRTFVRVICEESLSVPTWVTRAASLLGDSTTVCEIAVKEVNKCIEQTMWSVALVSLTQVSTPKAFLFITLAEKIECGEQETVPAIALDGKEIALTMWGSWTIEVWWTSIKDRSCWYWSGVNAGTWAVTTWL